MADGSAEKPDELPVIVVKVPRCDCGGRLTTRAKGCSSRKVGAYRQKRTRCKVCGKQYLLMES